MPTQTQTEWALSWIDNLADDLEVAKKIIESPGARKGARTLAAGALSYVVTRMDLIPDWEPACGILDDAMVLRVAVSLAAEDDLGRLDADTTRRIGRLANDAEALARFLGPELYPRFKRYVQDLTRKQVRGRTPELIVGDAKARALLYDEIKQELAQLPRPAPVDPERASNTVKSYLQQKLVKA